MAIGFDDSETVGSKHGATMQASKETGRRIDIGIQYVNARREATITMSNIPTPPARFCGKRPARGRPEVVP